MNNGRCRHAICEEARREVAREIFEEIEQNIFGDGKQNLVIMTAKTFAELKKKYTEGVK